jgi:hypothetical protein
MSALDELLRARTGPMTSEMVQRPGEFGLGRVPARLKPAATTSSVCGFCSTGCALKIHLNAQGEAINLTADPSYPVNLGMACPKGWEALTPLAASDRATLRCSAIRIHNSSRRSRGSARCAGSSRTLSACKANTVRTRSRFSAPVRS